MRTIELRADDTAQAVRPAAARVCDAAQARRLLSIAAVYEGMNRRDAAKIGGMDRQTLRDWVHRFNAEGPEGVVNRKPRGAAPKLTPEQKRALAALVEAGPAVERKGLIRWRRIDLKQVIRERFGVDYHERSVSRLLHNLGFSHVSARPQHPKQNAKAMDMFKKVSRRRSRRRSRICPPARP